MLKRNKFSYPIQKDFKEGILLGVCLSLGTQILTWLGYGLTNMFIYLTYFLLVVFIVKAQRKNWPERNRSIPFLQALTTVVIIVVTSRYVFQLYMYIYTTFIDPNWVNDVSVYWADLMRKDNIHQEEIDRSIENFRISFIPGQMFTIEIIKYGVAQIILGFITSLYFIIKKPS